jgi:hypothetical protein
MGKLTVYRHDTREIKDGDPMSPAGDHYGGLTGDQKLAEDAIRAGKPEGTQIRAESLYVYSDPEMAEADWKLKKSRHLYKLEIDEAAIRHRGDLQVFYEVMTAIRKKESPDELVKPGRTQSPVQVCQNCNNGIMRVPRKWASSSLASMTPAAMAC